MLSAVVNVCRNEKRGRGGDGFGKVSGSGISASWLLLTSPTDGRHGEGRDGWHFQGIKKESAMRWRNYEE